jgi:preprotein translocase subunit SecD
VLGLIFVVLYLFAFFGAGASGSFTERLHPKLGLDLVGGTQATYQASLQNGQPPNAQSMEQSRQIIESRVNAIGVSEAEVVVEGNRNIVVSVAGKEADELKNVGQAAQMRFRKVLKATGDVAATAVNPPSAAPSAEPGGGAPAPSASAPAAAASGGTGGQGGGGPLAAPAPSGPPSAESSPAPSASASAPAPVSPDQKAQLAAIQKKVGAAAWAAAQKLTDPVDLSQNANAGKPYAKFATLTPEEVTVLPAAMQFNVPTISCEQLDKRPPGAIDNEKAQVVSCQSGAKMLLDVAKVVGTDIDTASSGVQQGSTEWVVQLDFKSKGATEWSKLTSAAFNSQEPRNKVAVVLDGVVITAPNIISPIPGGRAEITGGFNQKSAGELAEQLKYGALPLKFERSSIDTVSSTLGQDQLRGGLISGIIGLALVVIYSLLYYRGLGIVAVLSLVVASILTYTAVVVLGQNAGFRLSLPHIIGLVVSIGITADSFIVYFERIRDEMKEGRRTLRAAVEVAWVRARRTILIADAVMFIAAVVLYVLAVGGVAGFAFAMGLTTLIDIVVVFMFTKPFIALLARMKFFAKGHPLSGLDAERMSVNPSSGAAGHKNTVQEA